MALTATLDKATYTAGEPMTLTVVRAVPAKAITVTISEADGATGTATASVSEPLTVADPDRAWTVKTDDGTTAVYTAAA